MDELLELELYAWVGRDEHGSGEIGIKAGNVPAGCIPLAAIRRDKIENLYPQLEAQAKRYVVKFKAVEVVRQTEHGSLYEKH